MSQFYSESRPAFVGEATYSIVVTIDGSGSIAGQTFSAAMWNPDGSVATGSPSASVTDAVNRVVTVTLPGQSFAGSFNWSLRRTDDSSGLVVAFGVVDVTDPSKP